MLRLLGVVTIAQVLILSLSLPHSCQTPPKTNGSLSCLLTNQGIFFPWLSNKQLLTYLITWQIIAAIVQGTIAYFANTKNYNLFTILLVAEVTLHALIVIGLQSADLSSDVSINSNNILGRQAIEIFIMPVLFMIL